MSTRSLIAIEHGDKSVSAVYCHSDGYPSYVGLFLYAFWTTEVNVRTLMGLGDLSSLGARVGYTVDFHKYRSDVNYYEKYKFQCISYCRDRNDPFRSIKVSSKEELYKTNINFSYIYIFRNGEWWVKIGKNKLRKLDGVLANDPDVLSSKRQKNFLTDKGLLEDEKQRLFDAYAKLGVLRITKEELNISDADYIIEQQFDANKFSVRCTANNRYSCLSRSDIQALKQEGCKIEIKKGLFIKI